MSHSLAGMVAGAGCWKCTVQLGGRQVMPAHLSKALDVEEHERDQSPSVLAWWSRRGLDTTGVCTTTDAAASFL